MCAFGVGVGVGRLEGVLPLILRRRDEVISFSVSIL